MEPYLGLLSTLQTRYKLVRDGRRLRGGVSLREFVSELGDKKVLTNRGKLTFSELAATGTDPRLVLYSDPSITKHFSGDGGLKRVVWMTKNLKESLKEAFDARAKEEGVPDLLDKIADETVAEDSEKLLEFLTNAGHPALTMDPII
jgi:hypothetical protein